MDKIPTYKVSIDPEEEGQEERLGMYAIAFTDSPAIITKGIAFSEQKPMLFKDEEKMRIAAPVMIPNIEIFRRDEDTGEEYNVVFDEEVIEQIHTKFMENMKNSDLFNLEHNEEETVPAYILEMWLVDDPKKDKSYSTFGIQVPKGTLFAVAQVTDEKYFQTLVENDQLGFSIEALLNLQFGKFKKQNTMNLPDGKFTLNGQEYEVVNGVPTLVEMNEEEANEETTDSAETSTEHAEDETSEEESNEANEEMNEEEAEEEMNEDESSEESDEEMAVDPEADSDAIMAIVQPMFDAFRNEVLEILADRLPSEEGEESEETEEEMSDVKMSAIEKLEKVRNYDPKKQNK